GLDESTALYEARRCLSCGNCFECDNYLGMCPDNAVIKLGPGRRYAIDLDYCKGCGICAAECPCGATEMTPEETQRPGRSALPVAAPRVGVASSVEPEPPRLIASLCGS